MEKTINVLTECINSNTEFAYQLYLLYIKDKQIRQELYRCDKEGINALFDSPADAVEAFMESGVCDLGEWEFLYLNVFGGISFSDDIYPVLNIRTLGEWITKQTDEYLLFDLYEMLDNNDFNYYFVKEISRVIPIGEQMTYQRKLGAWLEDNNYYTKKLLFADWNKIKKEFEDSLAL